MLVVVIVVHVRTDAEKCIPSTLFITTDSKMSLDHKYQCKLQSLSGKTIPLSGPCKQQGQYLWEL